MTLADELTRTRITKVKQLIAEAMARPNLETAEVRDISVRPDGERFTLTYRQHKKRCVKKRLVMWPLGNGLLLGEDGMLYEMMLYNLKHRYYCVIDVLDLTDEGLKSTINGLERAIASD